MAEGWGWLNCLQRQRTLLLVCDPLHTNTHANTQILHPNSLRHPSNRPSPPLSLQAGWTLNSMAATFLQIVEEGGALVICTFVFHSLCFLFRSCRVFRFGNTASDEQQPVKLSNCEFREKKRGSDGGARDSD